MDFSAPGSKELYAVLTGPVDDGMVRRVVASFNSVSSTPPVAVHLSLHSMGGNISDGIFLHNFLRTLPYPLCIYNTGTVASAAVPIFLAGRERVAASAGLFMIHRVAAFPPHNISSETLTGCIEAVSKDNARLEGILRAQIELPAVAWAEYAKRDLHITPVEAAQYGLIQRIGDFSPPLGAQVTQI